MTDVFLEIYNKLKVRLNELNVPTSDSYQIKQPTFPSVVIEEMGVIVDLETLDTDGVWQCNHTLEINIYSNSKTPRREIRPIINAIDEVMLVELKTNKNFSSQTPNLNDNTVFRYTMRFEFKVDKHNTINRR